MVGALKWTQDEDAFVIMYAEFCRQNGTSFRATVCEAFLKSADRSITLNGVSARLVRLLKDHSIDTTSKSLVKFWQQGTSYLNLSGIPENMMRKMKELDEEWDLDALKKSGANSPAVAEAAPGSPAQTGPPQNSASPTTVAKNSQVPCTKESPRGNKASKHGRVSDDDWSEGEDAMDEPPTKKRKKSPIVQVAKSRKQRKETTTSKNVSRKNVKATRKKQKPSSSVGIIGNTQTPSSGDESVHEQVQLPPAHNAVPQPRPTFNQAIPSDSEGKTLQDVTNDMAYLVAYLMRETARSKHTLSNEVQSRLRSIGRIVEKESGGIINILLQDLRKADEARTKLVKTIHSLIGIIPLEEIPHFPKTPKRKTIQQEWIELQRYFSEAFGITIPLEPRPRGVEVGYMASEIDHLTKPMPERLENLQEYIQELSRYLSSPNIIRALMVALVCRWLFGVPDEFSKAMYSEKELMAYHSLIQGGRIDDAQQIDKVGLQCMFDSEAYQNGPLVKEANRILERLTAVFEASWPAAQKEYFKLSHMVFWMTTAIKFKHSLMLSPKDYRIHFCPPGVGFDPTWMSAEDLEGFPLTDNVAQGHAITICLFPALVEQDPAPRPSQVSVDDVLTCNKNFFPTFKEKSELDLKKVVAKAVVLVITP